MSTRLILFNLKIFFNLIFEGKYQILLLENIERRQFVSPQINGSPNVTCLTFYYYLTKRDSVLLLIYYLNEEGQQKLIGGFGDVSFNGWHLARESFNPDSTSYRVFFHCFRFIQNCF
jgi:MAM domain-containing protein meprin/A5/mu